MRLRSVPLEMLLIVTALTAPGCPSDGPSNRSANTGTNATASPSPAPEETHPVFVISSAQARMAFDDYEKKGENNSQVSLGQRKVLDVSVQGQHSSESLKLSILFLSPREQARVSGYSFGLVAKSRTPADRKDYQDRTIKRVTEHADEIAFRVYLDQPKHESAAIPSINFELQNTAGGRLQPTTQPTDYVVGDRDILGAVGLAENGQPLTFPLLSGSSPFLTSNMNQMTLIVSLGEVQQNLNFQFK